VTAPITGGLGIGNDSHRFNKLFQSDEENSIEITYKILKTLGLAIYPQPEKDDYSLIK
jgi:hypothetical protein